jgi:NitT/TauT family transport system ATP-binding protein
MMPSIEPNAKRSFVAKLGVKIDLGKYPYQMSGGQQQLVSILRALVVEPEILFSQRAVSTLNYKMTLFMREQLQRLFIETRTTTLLVSHNLEEAVYLDEWWLAFAAIRLSAVASRKGLSEKAL